MQKKNVLICFSKVELSSQYSNRRFTSQASRIIIPPLPCNVYSDSFLFRWRIIVKVQKSTALCVATSKILRKAQYFPQMLSAVHHRGARKSTPPFGRLMTNICGVGRICSPGGFYGDSGVSNRKDHPFRVVFLFGAPSGTRTQGPLIKSQLLYQLS